MEENNNTHMQVEEIPIPEPCARCTIEPSCIASGNFILCPNNKIYSEYLDKCQEAYKKSMQKSKQ